MQRLGNFLYKRVGRRSPKRYLQEQRSKDAFLKELSTDLVALKPYLEELTLLAPSKRQFLDAARTDLNIQDWLSMYGLKGDLQKKIIDRLADFAFGKKNLKQTKQSLLRLLEPAFIEVEREKAQRSMHEVGITPEVIKRILPPSFAFEIGPDQKVVQEFSVFGNKLNTEERKSDAMALILSKWNDLVARLNADLESPDPLTRLSALVASIVVHTGVRPGAGGSGKLKTPEGELIRDEDGKPIRIDTVGATGLGPEHVQFVRDDFAKLEFPGKSGTINIATLDDPTLIKALQKQIQESRKGSEKGVIFVANDGSKVTPNTLNAYLKSIIGPEITATDFRKLKATRTFYEDLKARKSELRSQLVKLKFTAIADMKHEIMNLVLDHLESAAATAQRALSHEELQTTIESYISPRVVLHYLTHAGLDDALSTVVGQGKNIRVKFDPVDFYNKIRTEDMPELKAARLAGTIFAPGEEFTDLEVDETLDELEGA